MAVNNEQWSLGDKITSTRLQNMQDDSVNSTDNIHPQYGNCLCSVSDYTINARPVDIISPFGFFNPSSLERDFRVLYWFYIDEPAPNTFISIYVYRADNTIIKTVINLEPIVINQLVSFDFSATLPTGNYGLRVETFSTFYGYNANNLVSTLYLRP